MRAYRLIETDGKVVKSLFHGTNGSRTLPFNQWISADKKIVRDGSAGKEYYSGFHFVETKEKMRVFFDKFFRNKHGRVIVPCKVRGNIRLKWSGNCMLADEIYFDEDEIIPLISGELRQKEE